MRTNRIINEKVFVLTTFLYFAFTLCVKAQPYYFDWSAQYGGSLLEQVESIVTDDSGNVYTTGTFTGTVDFDPGVGVYNLTSKGNDDVFISKLDSSGNLLWVKSVGGTASDYSFSIAIDDSGNVYTTGRFILTTDFDPGSGTFDLTSNGTSYDAFILKLDASGNFSWAKKLSGANYECANTIAVAPSGSIYVGGVFEGTTDFDPGAGTTTLNAFGNDDVFIVKLNSVGDLVWAKQLGGASTDYVAALALDTAENIHAVGWFEGTADFNPGVASFNFTSAGSQDVFISKIDSSGTFVWAKQFGGVSADKGTAIAVDLAGNVYTTGSFMGTADFAGTFSLNSAGNEDIFISKLNAASNYVWSKQVGGSSVDIGSSLSLDSLGNVYIAGTFEGTADFDPGTSTASLTSKGSEDIFMLRLGTTGSFVMVNQFGAASSDLGKAITVDNRNNIYIAGSFTDTVDFDPGAGIANLSSAGFADAFILRLSLTPSTTGFSEQRLALDLKAFPNPATDHLNVVVDGFMPSTYSICDISGKLVSFSEATNTAPIETIDVSQLPKGMYTLKVSKGDKVAFVKFVKL